MSLLDTINRIISPDVREGYTYFGEWVISHVQVSNVETNSDGVALYTVEVYHRDGRNWKVQLRYSDFYNSMKWMEIYDVNRHLPCDVSFPEKDNNSSLFWYSALPKEMLEERRAQLDVWLKSRVNFCINSHAKVKVRIQTEVNYLLQTDKNLARLQRPREQYIVNAHPEAPYPPQHPTVIHNLSHLSGGLTGGPSEYEPPPADNCGAAIPSRRMLGASNDTYNTAAVATAYPVDEVDAAVETQASRYVQAVVVEPSNH